MRTRALERVERLCEALYATSARRVAIIGHSRGGHLARDAGAVKRAWEELIRFGDGIVSVEVLRPDGVVLDSQFAARTATIDGRRLVLGVLLAGGPVTFGVTEVTGQLTPRERAVVHLLTLGLTSPEIADRLSISVQTVRTQCPQCHGQDRHQDTRAPHRRGPGRSSNVRS